MAGSPSKTHPHTDTYSEQKVFRSIPGLASKCHEEPFEGFQGLYTPYLENLCLRPCHYYPVVVGCNDCTADSCLVPADP